MYIFPVFQIFFWFCFYQYLIRYKVVKLWGLLSVYRKSSLICSSVVMSLLVKNPKNTDLVIHVHLKKTKSVYSLILYHINRHL